jgi:SAM-dependent methyltransferase
MTSERVDLYGSTYGHFSETVAQAVRSAAFGTDIGQNSWITVDEFDRLIAGLELMPDDHVLEIASGSGGPARYLADRKQCRVTGIDADVNGVSTANRTAMEAGMTQRLSFQVADADARLPFENDSFDALVCIDALNHFPSRASVLRDWHRVLRPERRAVFTDPVVLTGLAASDELAARASIGSFVFAPPGVNERLIDDAGFRLVERLDVTDNAAIVSARWHAARETHRDALLEIEGHERFEGLQSFFAAVHRLSAERRLSRIAYVVEKPERHKP